MIPRVIYITPNAVLPANRGGRLRSHHLWRAMSALAEVHTIVVGDTPPALSRAHLRRAGTTFMPRRRYQPKRLLEAIAAGRPYAEPGLWEVVGVEGLPQELDAELSAADGLVRHCLNRRRIDRIMERVRAIQPDLVVLCDTTMGVIAPEVRARGIPVIVGPHNYDSDLYATMAASAPNPTVARWNAAAGAAFDEAERFIAPYVDQLWVCSRSDKERFGRLLPADKIRVVPNVWNVGLPLPLPETRDLVFVGQGGYYPNEDAALRLITVSQQLDARGVAHRMRLVGRAAASVRAAAVGAPSVEVLGEVPAVEPIVDDAAIIPIALTLGGGTRLKILEAMASGRPVLTTPIGIEGIEAENGVHAVIEPDLAAFPDRIVELFADRERAQQIASRGHAFVQEHYSHDALLRIVESAFQDLGIRRTASAAVLGANLGPEIRNETASFNALTRVMLWSFELRLAAPLDALSAHFDFGTDEDVPNAFVAVKEKPRGFVLIETTAVLPLHIPPSRAAVAVEAWGRQVLLHRAPAEVPEESAGLLVCDRTKDGTVLSGWSTGAEPVGIALKGHEPVAVQADAQGLFSVLLPDADTPLISTLPQGGIGQSLPNPKIWTAERHPSSLRLDQFSDRHRGETAWLIGNGPSVRLEDLESLRGQLTFGFNRLYLAYGQMQFRPTYTVTGDAQMIEDFGQEIVDVAGGTVFVVHDHPPDLVGDYIWVRMVPIYPPLFSKAADYIVSPGGSSLYMAMQIAYKMGVRKFYIYGADFRFSFGQARSRDRFRVATGDGNHFIQNYRSGKPWCPPSLKDIGAGFLTARLVMEQEGGFVRNASRGGALEMFERTPFDNALAASAGRRRPPRLRQA